MAQIHVSNLTFCYAGSLDNIFDCATFCVDTNWKIGLIGRNGKGKTTLLHLLQGKYPYQGKIVTSVTFDYFPYSLSIEQQKQCAVDWIDQIKPNCDLWKVFCELASMNADADLLNRPFIQLSNGEQTKVMLAILFSGENDFMLIDEPTNHLDQEARDTVKQYLQMKQGFILVSHDRDLLDACVNHVLVLNKKTITVQKGNFSSWWTNKAKQDHYAIAKNAKHTREIAELQKAVDRLSVWGTKCENAKIGFDPIAEHDRSPNARTYISSKSKKIQRKKAHTERRIQNEIEQKRNLLQDIDMCASLKLYPQKYHKQRLLSCRDLTLGYGGNGVINALSFDINQGDRIFLKGKNGCGKTTLIKALCSCFEGEPEIYNGVIQIGSHLTISYIKQNTRFLNGGLEEFCKTHSIDQRLFFALLFQLGIDSKQFIKPLELYSEGQKKKVLIAESLATKAHIYIWDEPLNYIDVIARTQIEEVLLATKPTMLVAEHDVHFQNAIATKVLEL